MKKKIAVPVWVQNKFGNSPASEQILTIKLNRFKKYSSDEQLVIIQQTLDQKALKLATKEFLPIIMHESDVKAFVYICASTLLRNNKSVNIDKVFSGENIETLFSKTLGKKYRKK